ncbi:MAG: hypothetical protein DWQ02_22390 [Bacteroidetes bacterium]|nr:MAG: hypothetical protein DWQ02_22390 [Bacteroidota bacterium]
MIISAKTILYGLSLLAFSNLTFLSIGITGCDGDPAKKKNMEEDNLVVLVSNESAERATIDFQLFIDGALKAEDQLEKKLNHRLEFTFHLTPGDHTIKIISKKGFAELEKEINVTDKHWVAMSYYYSSGQKRGTVVDPVFTFRFENEPIYFR